MAPRGRHRWAPPAWRCTSTASGSARNAGTTAGQAYTGYWRIGGDNIGGWGADGSYFNGDIDDVAIYPTALTAGQVPQHYTDSGRTLHRPTAADRRVRQGRLQLRDPTSTGGSARAPGPTAKDATPNQVDGIYSGGVTLGTAGAVGGTGDTSVTLNGSRRRGGQQPTGLQPDHLRRGAVVQDHHDSGRQADRLRLHQFGLDGGYDRHVYMFDDGRLRFGTWTGQTNVIDTDRVLQRRQLAPPGRRPRAPTA